ncbi:UNVERIFIED_CONTAM: hypothetical protein Slati_2821100 [Sesamum latifolium]|uniref:Uncharacterized protein n=1 Tax=Sesamum latifolium TaxID=2727402 RepID=A0AAW2VBC3_9LAMI
MIDERLLGHFDLSPQTESLGDSIENIMFGKLLRNHSGGRGGGLLHFVRLGGLLL